MKKIIILVLLVFLTISQLFADEKKIDVVYISQYYDLNFKLRTNACGPTSLMMFVSQLKGQLATSEEVEKVFYACTTGTGQNRITSSKKLAEYAKSFKVINDATVIYQTDWETIKSEINNDRPLIISTWLTKYGHLILVVGYKEENEKKYIIANDPAGNHKEGYWNKNGQNVMYEYGKHGIGPKYCIVFKIKPIIAKEFKLISEYPIGGLENVGEKVTASVRFNLDVHKDCTDKINSYVTVKRLGINWPREESFKIWAEGKKVYVICNQMWCYGSEYEVWVKKNLKGENGVTLKKNFSYRFTIRKLSFDEWCKKLAMIILAKMQKEFKKLYDAFEKFIEENMPPIFTSGTVLYRTGFFYKKNPQNKGRNTIIYRLTDTS